MLRYRNFALAAALAFAFGCAGSGSQPSDGSEGGGGRDGFGDDARPTPAERTGATGDSNRGGGADGMASLTSLSDEDRQFIQNATISNQMEVSLGNLAEDKAQNDRVKQFGEQLAREHEAANRELQSSIGGGDATTAQQPGGGRSSDAGTTPRGPRDQNAATGEGARENQHAQGGESPAMQQMLQTQQKLESVSGPAFDRAYLEAMVKHHEMDIQEFERAAQSDNPQVRAFAERTLPVLRRHLEEAQQLQQAQSNGQGQR